MSDYIQIEESRFGEAYSEEETFNITYDFEEWKEFASNINDEYFNVFFSDDIVSLAKKAKAYLLGPIGKDGKTVILARVSKFESIEEIEKTIDISKIYLYYFSLTKDIGGKVRISMRYGYGKDV